MTAFEWTLLELLYQEVKRFSGQSGGGFLNAQVHPTKSIWLLGSLIFFDPEMSMITRDNKDI